MSENPNVVVFKETEYLSNEYLATIPDGTFYAVLSVKRNSFQLWPYSVFVYERMPPSPWRPSHWAGERIITNGVFSFRWTARRWARKQLKKKHGKAKEVIVDIFK